jgi:transcriptional regulator with XRE-family HTH domain
MVVVAEERPAGSTEVEPIGEKLADALRATRISQVDVAKLAGVNAQTLNRVLKGRIKDPSFSLVVKIARAAGISLDALFEITARQDAMGTAKAKIEDVARILEQATEQLENQIRQMREMSAPFSYRSEQQIEPLIADAPEQQQRDADGNVDGVRDETSPAQQFKGNRR